MYEPVQEKLNKVRPYLQRDGGDVELVEIDDDGMVYLRLKGVCGSCLSSTITLKIVIERELIKVSGVLGVEQVY